MRVYTIQIEGPPMTFRTNPFSPGYNHEGGRSVYHIVAHFSEIEAMMKAFEEGGWTVGMVSTEDEHEEDRIV